MCIFLICKYELQEKQLCYHKSSTPNRMIAEFLPEIALRHLEVIENSFVFFTDFEFIFCAISLSLHD